MCGFLDLILFLSVSGWSLVRLFQRLRKQKATRGLWLAFVLLGAGGMGLGFWCALYCEYPAGKRYRIASFPIPACFFHLEQGKWVDYPVPEVQAYATVFTNILTITALTTSPVWWLTRQRRRSSVTTQSAGHNSTPPGP